MEGGSRVGSLPVIMVEVGVLMMCSDAVSQALELTFSRREAGRDVSAWSDLPVYDFVRSWRFGLIGALLGGPTFYYGFTWLDSLVPGVNFRAAILKVLLEQLIASPASHVALLSINTALASGFDMSAVRLRLETAFWPLQLTAWMVWPPAMIINFSVVPLHYQILVHRLFAMGWDIWIAHCANVPLEPTKTVPGDEAVRVESRCDGEAPTKDNDPKTPETGTDLCFGANTKHSTAKKLEESRLCRNSFCCVM
jgi:hypothetical protein